LAKKEGAKDKKAPGRGLELTELFYRKP